MALRVSCLVHGALLFLLLGCTGHRPVLLDVIPDTEIAECRNFVDAVADKMPAWDADDVSRYERAEIATVKTDIEVAKLEKEKMAFIQAVAKLHDDWDTLCALDEKLKRMELI